MIPHHSKRSHPGASALAGVMLLITSLLIACAPPASTPGRRPEPLLAAPAAPTEPASAHLVIRLQARRLDLIEGDTSTPVESFPIAVGREGHETPTGRFHVEEMVEHPDYHQIDPKDRSRVLKRIPPGPTNPLGERWIGFAHGDGWTIGIHGTPRPELLGRAVSGGCVRMRNADVLRIYDKVRLGTVVVVQP